MNAKDFEKQIISEVKQELADIDIEGRIAKIFDKKKIDEVIKRAYDDLIYRTVGDYLSLAIKKACLKKLNEKNEYIEQEVFRILAKEFNL